MKTAHFTQQKMRPGNGGTGRHRFVEIAREISATIGSAFFELLVQHLAEALEADCVYVGEFVGGQMERVQTLAAWGRDEELELFDFPLAGSPDAEPALGRPGIYSDGVTELFPSTELLKRLEASSFVGLPLNDPQGRPAGLIVALFRRAIGARVDFVQSMLMILVPRAAAELARRQAEDALRESEQRYRAFILQNTDAMWRIEFEQPVDTSLPETEQLERILRYGYLAECNEALARQSGAESSEQLLGSRILDVFPAQPEATMRVVRDTVLAFIRSRYQYGTVETPRVDTRGNQKYFLRTQWGIVSNGMLQRIWGSSRDITEYKSLEAQLQQSQKLQAIGQLAGGLAHDFNNLLTVIRGYCALLLDKTDKATPAYLALFEIAQAVDKGATLTRQLLTFSRRKVAEPQLVNLNNIVDELQQMLKSLIAERISLTMDLDPLLDAVLADPDDMHRVLVNLAINARDAMPYGGTLTITTSNLNIDQALEPRLAGIRPGWYVQLTVADSGSGMTEDVKAHLFEPFFTTKETDKGSGLGLAVVYGIVQQSRGHILVETAPGKGTTFEILLPRVSEKTEATAPVLDRLRGGSETILLVQNQTDLRKFLVTLLGGLGYTVLEADSSRQTLNLVRSQAGPVHLIITDAPAILKQRFLNAVWTAHPTARVLYTPGPGEESLAPAPHLEGRVEILQTVLTTVELLEKIRQILEQAK